MVRAAVGIGLHADQLVAFQFRLERTADAAVSARRLHDAIGLAVLDDGFLDQRGGGARLNARAARYAFGVDERVGRARGDRGIETAAGNGERKRSLHFFARAHAARADDALRRIEGEVRIRYVLRLIEMIRAGEAVPHVAQPDFARNVLQLAVAIGGTGQTVEWMVGNVQFEHAFPHARQRFRLGAHDHAGLDRCGARSRRTFAPLNFHEADPTRAERGERIGGAQFRNADAGRQRRAQHRSAFGASTAMPSMVRRTERSDADSRRAEVAVHVIGRVHGETDLSHRGSGRRESV